MIDGAHLEPILDTGYRCGFVFCLHGNDENNHENANIRIRNPKWKRKEMKMERFKNVSV